MAGFRFSMFGANGLGLHDEYKMMALSTNHLSLVLINPHHISLDSTFFPAVVCAPVRGLVSFSPENMKYSSTILGAGPR